MKSYLPKILMLLLLGVLAMLVSLVATPFHRGFVEYALAGQTREVLASANISPSHQPVFKHHFLQLPAGIDSKTQRDIIRLVDENVPGAYVPEIKSSSRVSVLRNDGVVVIEGSVATVAISDQWYELTKSNSPADVTVENRVVVSGDVSDSGWNNSLYAFADSFLGTPGSQFISVDETRVVLQGEVGSPAIFANINGMAEASIGNHALDNQVSVRAPLDQILPFSIEKVKPGRFALYGNAPDEASKVQFGERLVAAFAGQDIEVDNQLKVDASVYPYGVWPERVQDFAGRFLMVPGITHLVAETDAITLEGIVSANGIKEQQGQLAAMAIGEGNHVNNQLAIRVTEDPTFRLVQSTTGNYTINGLVNAQPEKDQLINAVQTTVGNEVVFNEIVEVKSGVKAPWWLTQSSALIPKFLNSTEHSDREISYSSNTVYLRGLLKPEQTIAQMSEAFSAGKPNGFNIDTSGLVEAKVVVEPAPIIAIPSDIVQVSDEFKLTAVYFDTNSSAVKEEAVGTIAYMAELINNGGLDRKVVVGGYADSRGDADANKALSLKRANSVKDRLIALGIPESQLSLQHFGEEASNYEPGDLWKSRRVELSFEDETETPQ